MVAGLALVLAGCFTPSPTRFVDAPGHTGIPAVKELRAEGDVLRITIVQEGGGIWVGRIEPQVIDGDVYLSATCISSVVRQTEFLVDLSGPHFPRDWRHRLYWIEEDSISSPVNPLIEHHREIRRSKIEVE